MHESTHWEERKQRTKHNNKKELVLSKREYGEKRSEKQINKQQERRWKIKETSNFLTSNDNKNNREERKQILKGEEEQGGKWKTRRHAHRELKQPFVKFSHTPRSYSDKNREDTRTRTHAQVPLYQHMANYLRRE
jgi:hypothetical protein